jgi:DNA-directed RNA polymerase subunit beta'
VQRAASQLLMLSSHNILNWENYTTTLPSQDMVLDCITSQKERKSTPTEKVKGEGKAFYSPRGDHSYNENQVDLHAYIKVKVNVEMRMMY